MTDERALLASLELFSQDPLVKGFAFYRLDGTLVGRLGEPPELGLADIQQRTAGIQGRSWHGDHYDVARVIRKMEIPYLLIVRHDSSSVPEELLGFIMRIAGLVLIIAIFVTGATFLVIQGYVITPLLQLRDDLTLAGDALSEGQQRPQFASLTLLASEPTNELSQTIRSFSQMFERVDAEIKRRQVAEAQVRAKAAELEQTLADLKEAQLRLIQTEKMSSLGQLVAGIAHELNNPATFIQGNLSALQDYFETLLELLNAYEQVEALESTQLHQLKETLELEYVLEDLPKSLKSTQSGVTRIASIVESLRNFARLDESERKTVDITQGIKNTISLLRSRLEAAQIQVSQTYESIPMVDCYPGLLNQSVLAILNNAIDALRQRPFPEKTAADATPRKLAVTVGNDAPMAQIKITIADNGPGIPPEVQQKMFDPFFTTKPVGQGTGLGLAIAYQIIVQDHGGQLDCHATPDQGTAFTIILPQSPAQPA
ncbi:sensor histidine kinase [Sodalinema gerasimenkoae]|uniref:sensor histidine kinase n=1 Tax=Sodalinema gerasimenkoae TaxID=2862348 RepID=UPI00135CD9DC|nr:ATP-binding protein [Sodalinema gerasimenkoae]